MKRMFLISLFILVFITPSFAKTRVVTTYPYIASIAEHITKELADVEPLAKGDWDPHFVIPKPSFIAQLRKADLLIINGADLEIGWLPPVIKQANNHRIQPGSAGFLELSKQVKLIDIPIEVSRAYGDVHPEGNPHFHLDPANIPVISESITTKLCEIDASHCGMYQKNNSEFMRKWQERTAEWNEKLKTLKGIKVLEYHRLYDYFLNRFNIQVAGTLEPIPGIPPSAKHIDEMVNVVKNAGVRFVLQDVYHPQKTAAYISEKTKIKMLIIPHDVRAVKEANDIFTLFDEIVRRLTQ